MALTMTSKVEVTIKYKQPGKRGYSFRYSLPMSWMIASGWISRAWSQIEEEGGTIIAVIVTAAKP